MTTSSSRMQKRGRPTYGDPEYLGVVIRRTHRALVRGLEQDLVSFNLNMSQWLTLELMSRGVIAKVSDVADEIGIEAGAATRLVDKLERHGHVVRERNSDDRRVVKVGLTSSGIALLDDIRPRVDLFWQRTRQVIGLEDIGGLIDRLQAAAVAMGARTP